MKLLTYNLQKCQGYTNQGKTGICFVCPETEETWQLSATYNSGLDGIGTNGKT